jgi:hypothetical protein
VTSALVVSTTVNTVRPLETSGVLLQMFLAQRAKPQGGGTEDAWVEPPLADRAGSTA